MSSSSTEPVATPRDLRNFGLLMAGVISLVFGAALPWYGGRAIPLWPWIVGATFSLPAVARPALLRPLFRAWMWIGGKLGAVNSRIILGLVYLVFFIPIALVMRLVSRDRMARHYRPEAASYRVEVPPSPPGSRNMERPF